jgi:hypothetical protein
MGAAWEIHIVRCWSSVPVFVQASNYVLVLC